MESKIIEEFEKFIENYCKKDKNCESKGSLFIKIRDYIEKRIE